MIISIYTIGLKNLFAPLAESEEEMTSKKYNSKAYIHECYELNCDTFNAVRIDTNVCDSKGYIINDDRPGFPIGNLMGSWEMVCSLEWLKGFLSKAVAIVPIYYTVCPARRKMQFIAVYGPSPSVEKLNNRPWWKLTIAVYRDDGYNRPSVKMGRKSIIHYNPMAYWNWKFGDDVK